LLRDKPGSVPGFCRYVPTEAPCGGAIGRDLSLRRTCPYFKNGGGILPASNKTFCSSTCPDCAMVAQYLIALRQNSKKRKPKRPSSAKLLLRQLEPERRETAELVSLARAPQWRTFREEWLRGQIEILDRIDQIRSNIEWMLPILSPKPDPNRVRLIAAVATQAWQQTNDGRTPKSKNPDGLLCRFVASALAAIGQARSQAAISES